MLAPIVLEAYRRVNTLIVQKVGQTLTETPRHSTGAVTRQHANTLAPLCVGCVRFLHSTVASFIVSYPAASISHISPCSPLNVISWSLSGSYWKTELLYWSSSYPTISLPPNHLLHRISSVPSPHIITVIHYHNTGPSTSKSDIFPRWNHRLVTPTLV